LSHPLVTRYIKSYVHQAQVQTPTGKPDVIESKDGSPWAECVGLVSGMRLAANGAPRTFTELEHAAFAAIGEDSRGTSGSAFVLPPAGVKALRASVEQHAKDVERTDFSPAFSPHHPIDSESPACRAYRSLVEQYGRATFDAADGLGFFNKFLRDMDGTKSAGWSALVCPGPKNAWRKPEALDLLWVSFVSRLVLRSLYYHDLPLLLPEQMHKLGLNDPKVLFLKGEAHSEKKARSGKYRVIWIPSLLDSLCQAFVHERQNKRDLQDYADGTLHC